METLAPVRCALRSAGPAQHPPEPRLKARVWMALYSVRSKRLFCEPVGSNRLWLSFPDRECSQGSFKGTVFAKNAERVPSAEVARLLLAEVDALSHPHDWTRDEPFTADGTRIESWASPKSLVRKDGSGAQKRQAAKEEDPGHPAVDFRSERRSATHRSTTDPESVLDRKTSGKEARLCLEGPVLRENRPGLWTEFRIQKLIAEPDPAVALQRAAAVEALDLGVRVRTVGADKGYDRKDFGGGCRQREIVPHVACMDGVRVTGWDGRTTSKVRHRLSEKVRKRVEEIFGWIQTVGNGGGVGIGCISLFEQPSTFPEFSRVRAARTLRDNGFLLGYLSWALKK